MINCIVAVDKNWGIGKNNKLLFNLKKDMQYFKKMTENKIVLMGENTLLSMPGSKPLKNRVNVVLCPEGHEYEGCICLHSFDAMLNFAKILSKEYELFVIGGGYFYSSMLPYCDNIYVTKINALDKDATVFFPNLDMNDQFKIADRSETFKENDLEFSFVKYQKLM